nr:hypothetical chloroplast RF88 [Naviculales sp.]
MNRILYERRCRCREELLITKKRRSSTRSEGKLLEYPELTEVTLQTFQLKYEKPLSSTAKSILNSFQNKYIYYAIDDILYLFQENPIERDNLLAILYSPILSLQNNFSINFFDIWIRDVYIEEISKVNRFLKNDSQTLEQFNYITVKLFYQTREPIKKREPLW